MKKQLIILTALLLPIAAMAGGDVCINGIYYDLDTVNKTAEVSKNQHYGGTEVIIAESFEVAGVTYRVTSIRKDAFNHCSSFTSLTIPNSVTRIGAYAFLCCKGITSVSVSKNVTTIGECAFSGCSGLTSMVVESGNAKYDSRNNCNAIIETATNTLLFGCKSSIIADVTSIADYAFYEIEGMTAVSIPSSVVTIGKNNFSFCPDLESLTLANGLTSVGEMSFYLCNLSSLTIPKSLTTIGSMAFVGSKSLASAVVESGNPNYDSRNNCNCIIETATNTLLLGSKNCYIPDGIATIGLGSLYAYAGTNINIPSSVTKIENGGFTGCVNLSTINIPNSVTNIGGSAFNGCTALTSVTLSNNLENISESLFAGCKSLTTLVIPDKVKSIGSSVFNGCTALSSLTCLATTPPICNETTFSGFNQSTCTLSVLPGCKGAYQQADYWKEFFTIDENTTKIDMLRSYSPAHTNIYNLEGLHQGSTRHGVNIVRMTDGTTRKVVVK